MYYIIDDNQNFVTALCHQLNGDYKQEDFPLFEKATSQIADEVIAEIKSEDTIILINVNLKIKDGNRQDQKGIELLKWLRLKKCNNHVVLYSFQSFLQILKTDPLNSIIHSKGVSFIQLPFSTADVLKIDTSEKAEKGNLLPFFRAEVDLVAIRHTLANIYGLQKVIQFHSQIRDEKLSISLSEANKYTYKLIEYLQGSIKKQAKFILDDGKKNDLQNNKLKSILDFQPQVIYLDDEADNGWFDFLKNIIGNGLKKIAFDKSDDENTLFKKFETLQNNQPVSLFICDLRLKSEEENVLNFKDLISYKLVRKIRNKSAKQKIMYFSATNDLNKYKSLLGGASGNPDKYKPQYIFTKEGIDQNYSEEQSFHNYEGLINFFNEVFKTDNARKKIQSLYLFDLFKAEQVQRIEAELEKLKMSAEIKNSRFEDFDLVVFDTNAFYKPDISIQILRHIHKYHNKSCIHLSVFAEMKNFSNVHKSNADKEVQWLLATKCVEYFEQSKFTFSKECMTSQEIDNYQKLNVKKDSADQFLINLCKEKSKNLKVLFVSDDRAEGKRKQKGEADGPVPQLKKWIADSHCKNLSICSSRDFFTVEPTKTKKNQFPQYNSRNNKQRQKTPVIQQTSITSTILEIKKTSTKKSYRFFMEQCNEPILVPIALFKDKDINQIQNCLLNSSFTFENEDAFKKLIENKLFNS